MNETYVTDNCTDNSIDTAISVRTCYSYYLVVL